jgi:hypothetical protein
MRRRYTTRARRNEKRVRLFPILGPELGDEGDVRRHRVFPGRALSRVPRVPLRLALEVEHARTRDVDVADVGLLEETVELEHFLLRRLRSAFVAGQSVGRSIGEEEDDDDDDDDDGNSSSRASEGEEGTNDARTSVTALMASAAASNSSLVTMSSVSARAM